MREGHMSEKSQRKYIIQSLTNNGCSTNNCFTCYTHPESCVTINDKNGCTYNESRDKCNITGCGVDMIAKGCQDECCENTNTPNNEFWLTSNYGGVLNYYMRHYNNTGKLGKLSNGIEICYNENPSECVGLLVGGNKNRQGIIFPRNNKPPGTTRFSGNIPK